MRGLTYDGIKDVYERHGVGSGVAFEEAFADSLGSAPEESLNESHRLVLVAAELDPSSERIVSYLADEYGVPINAVFFRFFRDGETGSDYLARSWLIDPAAVEVKASRAASRREPWNGHDYYVTFGPRGVAFGLGPMDTSTVSYPPAAGLGGLNLSNNSLLGTGPLSTSQGTATSVSAWSGIRSCQSSTLKSTVPRSSNCHWLPLP